MPYISKYYTCEEVDQRLLQGYYDDFVKAGFIGTLLDFHKFVLSIKDKIDKGDYDEAIKQLEERLNQKIDDASVDAEAIHNQLKEELEKTIDQKISDLIDGADESLNTLKELADALNNDANFGSKVINMLTELRKDLDAETQRAKDAEQRLTDDLKEEISKREEADKGIIALIDGFNQRLLDLQKNIGDFQTALQDRVNSLEQNIHDVEDRLGQAIQDEAQARKDAINDLKDTITEVRQDINTHVSEAEQAVKDVETKIQLEASTRQSEDAKLQSAINEEAVNRASDKAEVMSKIAEETTSRIAQDDILNQKIDAETRKREADIQEVKSEIQIEAANRENEDNLIRSEIQNLKDNTSSRVEELLAELRKEIARAKEAEEGKVDKKEGYGLSKNDFTDELFEKLVNLDQYANYITRTSELINDSDFQTGEDVKKAIEEVVGAAPDALNTLQELADALGNDANFASTITNKITALATQLNKEVEDREKADEELRKAYQQAIEGAVNNLQAALTVLQGTVDANYKTLSGQLAGVENDIDDLTAKVDEVKDNFTEKINDLRTNLTEKFNELNTKWVEFKTSVEGTVVDQNAKISANTAAIQTNLELIQALQQQYNTLPETVQGYIKTEAELRKAADDALKSQIDLLNTVVIQNKANCDAEVKRLELQMANDKLEINNTIDKMKDDLEDLIKNSSNTVGSESIKVTKQQGENGTETKVEVIVNPDDPLLSIGPKGVQSEFTVDKDETEDQVTYTIKGKGGEVIETLEVPKKMGEDFTEDDAEALFNKVYGEAFNPDAPGALTGMTPEDAERIYNEVYNG